MVEDMSEINELLQQIMDQMEWIEKETFEEHYLDIGGEG